MPNGALRREAGGGGKLTAGAKFGEIAAMLACGEPPPMDIAAYRPDRPPPPLW